MFVVRMEFELVKKYLEDYRRKWEEDQIQVRKMGF